MIASAMPLAMIAYSMAVVPDSLRTNRLTRTCIAAASTSARPGQEPPVGRRKCFHSSIESVFGRNRGPGALDVGVMVRAAFLTIDEARRGRTRRSIEELIHQLNTLFVRLIRPRVGRPTAFASRIVDASLG